MTISIAPRDPATGRRPKDTLEVRGEWSLVVAPQSIEARLLWYTSGKGTTDVGVVETQHATPAASGSQNFRFKLPDGPYSFSGRLISLRWAVELVAGVRSARWEFTLSPSGEEIRLSATGEGTPARGGALGSGSTDGVDARR